MVRLSSSFSFAAPAFFFLSNKLQLVYSDSYKIVIVLTVTPKAAPAQSWGALVQLNCGPPGLDLGPLTRVSIVQQQPPGGDLRRERWCPAAVFTLICVCRTILRDSGFFRYLHTAVIVSGSMLVFGGNTHNDTSMSHGAKCFSSDFLVYNLGKQRGTFG